MRRSRNSTFALRNGGYMRKFEHPNNPCRGGALLRPEEILLKAAAKRKWGQGAKSLAGVSGDGVP